MGGVFPGLNSCDDYFYNCPEHCVLVPVVVNISQRLGWVAKILKGFSSECRKMIQSCFMCGGLPGLVCCYKHPWGKVDLQKIWPSDIPTLLLFLTCPSLLLTESHHLANCNSSMPACIFDNLAVRLSYCHCFNKSPLLQLGYLQLTVFISYLYRP